MLWAAVAKGSPYLQIIGEVRWDGGPPPHFIFVGHYQSRISAGAMWVASFENSLLFLDVSCSSSNSRMKFSCETAHFIPRFSHTFNVDSPDFSVLETAPETALPSGLLPHISAEKSVRSHQSAEASRQVRS